MQNATRTPVKRWRNRFGGGASGYDANSPTAASSDGVVHDYAENVNMSSGRMRLGRTRCYRTLPAVVQC